MGVCALRCAARVCALYAGCMRILIDLFFRDVRSRGAFRIPTKGALIFVAAPHANQFVDPLLLMRQVQLAAARRISFLIAEKSMRRWFIGRLARLVASSMPSLCLLTSVPVVRPLDRLRPGTGRVRAAGAALCGRGTRFTAELGPGSVVVVGGCTLEVAAVLSDSAAALRAAASSPCDWAPFEYAAKVDQTAVYAAVFQRLDEGGCIGIFPEGGSHDRTDLLPLKGMCVQTG
ncbi:hypothetical protein PMAC_000355 [Pneumocystis sp. 'macacae']|nr:hypothetical protein PMAC_000355 [Pneumocystis sp. 'macacae']